MEFLQVDTLESAREKLLACSKDWLLSKEVVALGKSLGRILSEDITSQEEVPHFRRSTVDGYAVISADTAAAGENIPVFLTIKGLSAMGDPVLFSIINGECAEVSTGGMIPDGADAVVMVEYSEPFSDNEVAIHAGVSYGENVVQIGEDIKSSELLLERGRRIMPQDIGALAAVGITDVPVYAPVKLTIISTGDELVSPEKNPGMGQIRDVNTYALSALAQKIGINIVETIVLSDDLEPLKQAVLKAKMESDIVIISGGSSKGKADLTREVFESASKPGVFTHGLALKPGKPTILGFDNPSKTLLVGLPGHPVAAMLVFESLLGWLKRKLSNTPAPHPISAKITCNIASASGRQNCWLTKLKKENGEYIAEPIFGKSGLISTLSKADGYFLVERDKEGLEKGQTVLVHLL
jgi:molybdopterin molybdotransferase